MVGYASAREGLKRSLGQGSIASKAMGRRRVAQILLFWIYNSK